MRIVPLLSVVAMFLSGPASSPAALVLDAQRGVATLEPYFTQITGRVDTNLGSFRLSDARYRRSLGKVPVSDPFGNGPWQTIEARDARGKIDLRLSLRADDRGHWIGKLWLANRSSKPLRLYSLVIEATRPGDWRGGRVNKLGAYESLHLNVELKAGESYGGVYATATNRPAFAGGFLTTEHYLGLVSVAPDKGGLRSHGLERRRGCDASGRRPARERAGVVLGRTEALARTRTVGQSGRTFQSRSYLVAQLCHVVLVVLGADQDPM